MKNVDISFKKSTNNCPLLGFCLYFINLQGFGFHADNICYAEKKEWLNLRNWRPNRNTIVLKYLYIN